MRRFRLRMPQEGPTHAGYRIGETRRDGRAMNANAKISKTLRTALACAAFATAGAVWAEDCNINGGEMEAAASDGSQTDGMIDVGPVNRLDPELYTYLHDPRVHRGDGLGQDFGNIVRTADER